LTLHGEVQDPLFLHFLEKVGKEVLASFTTRDFLLLDFIHREESLPPDYSDRIHRLLDLGVIVRAGKGKYILSKRFYAMAGKKGVYTRKKGLDRDTNKALLLKHVKDNKKTGTRLDELLQVLPALSYNQVQTLMRELKNEGAAHVVGKTRGALWYPGGE
jgi:ATP-dependent DNA helicase RecG